MTIPVPSKKYMLHHERFGTAIVKVRSVDEIWCDVEIVSGQLVGMTETWVKGDVKTVRLSHCIFTPIQ